MNNSINNLSEQVSSDSSDGGKHTSIAMVVAASTNNAIGKDNQLLWNLPNDMRFFKNITWGFPVIMGRKTFEVFDKPLAGRTNIVITRQPGWKAAGAITATDLQDAIKKGEETNAKQLYIIGGGEIYKQSMEVTDTIYITRVHAVLEGDAYFPVIEESQWMLDSNEDFPADDKHAFAYSFQVWKKR
jgi:dihydrofolate reductase